MKRLLIVLVVIAACGKSKPSPPPPAKYDAARAAIQKALPAKTAAAFVAAVDDLQKRGQTVIYVDVSADYDSTTAATEWVKQKAAEVQATASTVFPFYASSGNSPGGDDFQRQVAAEFGKRVPEGFIRFETPPRNFEKIEGPILYASFAVKPTGVFLSGGRVFAATELTYRGEIRVGTTTTALTSDVVVPPPSEVSVTQLVFKGDKPRAVGESASIHEDSQVYCEQVSTANKTALPKLVAMMFE